MLKILFTYLEGKELKITEGLDRRIHCANCRQGLGPGPAFPEEKETLLTHRGTCLVLSLL